jgi:hypothetical protein
MRYIGNIFSRYNVEIFKYLSDTIYNYTNQMKRIEDIEMLHDSLQ